MTPTILVFKLSAAHLGCILHLTTKAKHNSILLWVTSVVCTTLYSIQVKHLCTLMSFLPNQLEARWTMLLTRALWAIFFGWTQCQDHIQEHECILTASCIVLLPIISEACDEKMTCIGGKDAWAKLSKEKQDEED